MTVGLTRHSPETIFPAFAEGLSHLPNLHTLYICHASRNSTALLRNVVKGKSYPQIRTIVLPTSVHPVLRACPNIVDVGCNQGEGKKLFNAMTKQCKHVEVIEGILFDSGPMINGGFIARFHKLHSPIVSSIDLPKRVPKLRKLTLRAQTEVRATILLMEPCVSSSLAAGSLWKTASAVRTQHKAGQKLRG